MLGVLIIISSIATLIYLKLIQRPPNFPPGPRGIPILGNLLQIGQSPFLKFQNEWKAKYGPIIGLYFGSFRTVAISDYRMIRQALLDPLLSGRPDMLMWHVRSRDTQGRGILFTQGEEHTEQRRIALKSLKDFGYGMKSFENIVTAEISSFLLRMENSVGVPIYLKNKFHVPLLSILWHVVAGRDCEEDKHTLYEIFSKSTKIMEENNGLSALFMFIPWLCKYFPAISGYDKLNSELEDIWAFLQTHIDDHKRDHVNSPLTFHDFIGAYIHEMEKTTDPTSSFFKRAGDRGLMSSLIDLFFAGTDTLAGTLHWSMLIFAKYPEIQQKFADEIENVIGTRTPEQNDEPNMPYTQALINEILRYTSIAPLAIFHNAMQDVRFHGYDIQKDTMVLLNLHGAHHDKNYWGDPEKIRPERFLAADGTTPVKHEAFLAFGAGKRLCVGEAMGRKELFLFLTSIVQNFRISTDPDNPNPNLDPTVSFILMPPNHRMIFEKRVTNV
ncbi:cytochrome P450 2J6 [Folsomia candida]|uniref:cytochrome P450 2J6 n=1 Tax=Folsomia candida TaxID=158441 RepID=UPI000B8F2C07|nr:cytochrome P450 2J6 [Folsomia candida]